MSKALRFPLTKALKTRGRIEVEKNDEIKRVFQLCPHPATEPATTVTR